MTVCLFHQAKANSINKGRQRLIIELETSLGRRAEEYNQYAHSTDIKLNQLSIDNSDLQQDLARKDSEVYFHMDVN
jgi:hypothetical protein